MTTKGEQNETHRNDRTDRMSDERIRGNGERSTDTEANSAHYTVLDSGIAAALDVVAKARIYKEWDF